MRIDQQLRSSDLFDRLMPERKQDVKKIKIERSPALDDIVGGFGNVVEAKYPGGYNDKEFYEFCTRHVPDKYSAKDIEYFSILLSDYQSKEEFGYKAGLYLSALTNHCKDENVTICTHLLERLIYSIGYENENKHVTVKGNAGGVGGFMKDGAIHVKGNAGDDVGDSMEGGVITVKGNAGDHVGSNIKGGVIKIEGNAGDYVGSIMEGGAIYVKGNTRNDVGFDMKEGVIKIEGNAGYLIGEGMEGGVITVKGNAGKGVGRDMKSGAIHVKGNAGDKVGWGMEGGEIYIDGKLKSLAEDIEGGNIYHKGKLIVNK